MEHLIMLQRCSYKLRMIENNLQMYFSARKSWPCEAWKEYSRKFGEFCKMAFCVITQSFRKKLYFSIDTAAAVKNFSLSLSVNWGRKLCLEIASAKLKLLFKRFFWNAQSWKRRILGKFMERPKFWDLSNCLCLGQFRAHSGTYFAGKISPFYFIFKEM